MTITKPNRLQRAYIEAVGCRPVAFMNQPDGQRISTARNFWDCEYMSASAFWLKDEVTAKKVKQGANDALLKQDGIDIVDLAEFDRALSFFCSQQAIHFIAHQNLMRMADGTIDIVEKEYHGRKERGEFRPYFKAQKEARQMAKLLGQKVQSAALDEIDLKITIMRHAVDRGR